MGYRDYSTAKGHIVDSTGHGDFTTVSAALAVAVSGQTIFIRPGTYTEDITLKAGVNLSAFSGDSPILANPVVENVLLIGKINASFAGNSSISNISLRTNSDYFLSVTGASLFRLAFNSCYLDIRGHVGIFCSNPSAQIQFNGCEGELDATASYFDISAGAIEIEYSEFGNSSISLIASTLSGGVCELNYSEFHSFISASSNSEISLYQSSIGAANVTCVELTGTSSCSINQSDLGSGTAPCLNIGAGCSADCFNSSINSTNANAITGTGTLNYAEVSFVGSSTTINPTLTRIPLITRPSFSTVNQVFTANGTYTPTFGMSYCQIELVGAGGGSGGTAISSAAIAVSQSGGSGGYSKRICTSAQIGASQAVTIGAGGTAGAAGNNNGGTGGTSSVGALISATGGAGGVGGASAPGGGSPGAIGGIGSTGDINIRGGSGGTSIGDFPGGFAFSGSGGSSYFGGGPSGVNANSVGTAGTSYGTGASGSASFNTGSTQAGAAGADGVVIIQEYILS